jgi:uncharacterized protein
MTPAIAQAVVEASARVAPVWPLDRMIAVNPYWGFVSAPMTRVSQELAALNGARMVMPLAWYRERWTAGAFTRTHLERAVQAAGLSADAIQGLMNALRSSVDEWPERLPLYMDLVDAAPASVSRTAEDSTRGQELRAHWSTLVTRSVSQACAAYFDHGQATLAAQADDGLFALWRSLAAADATPRILMGDTAFSRRARNLPERVDAMIEQAVERLQLPRTALSAYFSAQLLRMQGWAAACAFRQWDARLNNEADEHLKQLLAIRLAWDCLLFDESIEPSWRIARQSWEDFSFAVGPKPGWVFQRALEFAFQESIVRALRNPPIVTTNDRPTLQAVFCIDVRSEVYRRALEQVEPDAQTLGFAGFFGLPIGYQPTLGALRAQLPGLLAPTLRATDTGMSASALAKRERRLVRTAATTDLATNPTSMFSFVELSGVAKIIDFVADTFSLQKPVGDVLRAGEEGKPRVSLEHDATDLAAKVLAAMGLGNEMARLVLLTGHGAASENNPQVCGLHCGACGGQTGEVNARALADLLNRSDVRIGLRGRGISIPADSQFLAALHNTTTDEVTVFDTESIPPSHREDLMRLKEMLEKSSQRARAERAPRLGVHTESPTEIANAIKKRANDWSEIRPEWGLARNAAFIVAPRARSRAINLDGRAFLHDYRWQEDRNWKTLELIMTAPMVVTHWINMQYYASTVDNERYGSGNKTLHNVVGGNVGVFEGAGGDLRTGLALQSLHDGECWVHEPLRLSVFIEAPESAIEGIIAAHSTVRDLVDNEWIFLFRIDPVGRILARTPKGWSEQTQRVLDFAM